MLRAMVKSLNFLASVCLFSAVHGEGNGRKVAALGRLEPGSRVIKVSAAAEMGRVARLMVSEGQKVQAKDVLAYTELHADLLAQKSEAEAKLAREQALLAAEAAKARAKVAEAKIRLKQLEQLATYDVESKSIRIKELETQLYAQRRYDDALIKIAESELKRLQLELSLEITMQETIAGEQRKRMAAQAASDEAAVNEAELEVSSIDKVTVLEIKAQEATVRQSSVGAKHTASELDRFTKLAKDHAVSAQEVEARKTEADSAREVHAKAVATLEKMKESQQIRRQQAIAALASAKAHLINNQSKIRVELSTAESTLSTFRSTKDSKLEEAAASVVGAKAAKDRAGKEIEVELNSTKPVLAKLKESIVLDIEMAEAKLRTAEAELQSVIAGSQVLTLTRALKTIEATLERSIVYAPISGEILKIFARPGEDPGGGPILHMGDTDQMYAVAEVYETDIRFVKKGQSAKVLSPALSKQVEGVVDYVSPLIYKNDVLDVDPAADTDARVVEVRIRLNDSTEAKRLTNLQVDVVIKTM